MVQKIEVGPSVLAEVHSVSNPLLEQSQKRCKCPAEGRPLSVIFNPQPVRTNKTWKDASGSPAFGSVFVFIFPITYVFSEEYLCSSNFQWSPKIVDFCFVLVWGFSIICNLQVVMYSMCPNALKSFFFLIPKCPILGQWQLLQSVSCPFDGTQTSIS